MSDSDVKSKRITATGSLAVGHSYSSDTVEDCFRYARLTVTDGNGGTTVLDLDFNASDTHSVNIPSNGIRVSDIHVSTLTNITAATFFFN